MSAWILSEAVWRLQKPGPFVSLRNQSCVLTPSGDRMVEEAMTLDLLDANTRVTKTNYRLGWPSR